MDFTDIHIVAQLGIKSFS